VTELIKLLSVKGVRPTWNIKAACSDVVGSPPSAHSSNSQLPIASELYVTKTNIEVLYTKLIGKLIQKDTRRKLSTCSCLATRLQDKAV
jgi:hypothetical protein